MPDRSYPPASDRRVPQSTLPPTRRGVRKADEPVAQVMKNLAETVARERSELEGELNQSDTERLRMALRRYRSCFQRLLSL